MKTIVSILAFMLFPGFLIAGGSDPASEKATVPERGFISSKAARTWEEGLICGNGTIGVNILSRPLDETVIFSHERLFLPQGPPTIPPVQSHRLPEIRDLISRGLYKEATELAFELSGQESFMYPDPYVPAFDLRLQMEAVGCVQDYFRSVDFQTGEAIVHWSDDRGVFERKMFVSRADGLAIMLITGPKEGISCTIGLEPRKPGNNLDIHTIAGSYDVFNSHISDITTGVKDHSITYSNRFSKAYPGSIQSLEGVARVVLHQGELTEGSETISIKGASQLLLFIDLDVIYDPEASVASAIQTEMSQLPKDYQVLLNRHGMIHGELFNRMKLDLGGGKDHLMTTEELMEQSTMEHMNMALLEKEFDAARYNIISCMGELPPTLQGVWGGTYIPGWASDFTHNGNVPSAMASVLMGNMPELMFAYTSYMESMVPYMEINASHMFGCRGIVLPSRSSANAYNNALAPSFAGGFWVGGAAWAAHFFFDYYLYTGDRDFLARHALPFMEKAVAFFEDYLYEGPDGKFIFSPTQSPENTPGNTNSQGTFNATMDVAATRELLTNIITASEELGVNRDRIPGWKLMIEKLPLYMISRDGIIKEWLTPVLENNDAHRHSSQLYALYDGITPEIAGSPSLQEAFRKSIEYKLEKHWRGKRSGFMSFGLVQLGQAAASLGEGELAYECMQHLVNRFWLNNLASMHNHRSLFNMDISGGMPAVLIKMLILSDPGRISLLPALPSEWTEGVIEGVLCRGQIEVERLSWNGKEIRVTLLSEKKQAIMLELPLAISGIQVVKGMGKTWAAGETTMEISLPEGKAVTLTITLR